MLAHGPGPLALLMECLVSIPAQLDTQAPKSFDGKALVFPSSCSFTPDAEPECRKANELDVTIAHRMRRGRRLLLMDDFGWNPGTLQAAGGVATAIALVVVIIGSLAARRSAVAATQAMRLAATEAELRTRPWLHLEEVFQEAGLDTWSPSASRTSEPYRLGECASR